MRGEDFSTPVPVLSLLARATEKRGKPEGRDALPQAVDLLFASTETTEPALTANLRAADTCVKLAGTLPEAERVVLIADGVDQILHRLYQPGYFLRADGEVELAAAETALRNGDIGDNGDRPRWDF